MLYALRYPFSFAVLVVAFVIGLWLRGAAQRLVTGQRRPAWARRSTRRRDLMWLRPFVDPYGVVAAAISGPGWGPPIEATPVRGRVPGKVIAQLLAGPVVLFGAGVAALAGFRAWTHMAVGGSGVVIEAFRGELLVAFPSHIHYVLGYGEIALLLAGIEWLAMGVLAILPLPPLDGGKLLFALAPRTMGWQRARYRLDEENWSLLILLVISLPVIFRIPLGLRLLDKILDPLIRVLS